MGTGWVPWTLGRARRVGRGLPRVVSPGVGPQRSLPAIAAPSPRPATGLSQMQIRGLAAPCFLPLAAVSLLVSFLSHFWGWGGWGLRKCAQGRRPGRGSSVPGALAHPPGPRVAGLPLAPRREGSGAEPRAGPEGLSRPRTPASPARRPCVCLILGLNRPAGAGKENRSPHPAVPLPAFLWRLVFLFCFALLCF